MGRVLVMKRNDFLFGLIPYGMTTAGAVWMLGPVALVVAGLLLMIAWLLTDWEV